MSAPATTAQIKARDRAMSALESIHDCDPDGWTVRIVSPGFHAPDYVGMTTWVCADCHAFMAKIVDDCYGGHVVKQRGERS